MRRLALLARQLGRRPAYVVTVIATLTIGIGASTSIFSILHGTVLRPLPYPEPDRLIRIRDAYPATGGGGGMSIPNYMDLRAEARTLDGFAAFNIGSVNLAAQDAPLRARSLTVTANFFAVLGVSPFLGRGFREGEDRAGTPRIAVISERLWRERFGGRREALGETLEVNAEPYTIVGVLPASFWYPGDPQLVIPYVWDERDLTQNRGSRQLEGFGRLAPGVSQRMAETELRTIFRRLEEAYPGSNDGWSVATFSIREWMLGYNRTSLWLLSGGVLLVLLIGCVNVANLMLVRAERRQREIAVRAAIGAGRGRIIRDFLTESLTLAVVASALGVALAWGVTQVLLSLFGGALPRAEQVGLGAAVVGFAVGLALVTGLLVGLVPALRTDTGNLQQALREGAMGVIGGGSRLQKSLVAVEVALAVMLVAGAGLLLNSFWRLNQVETGIETENAFAFRTELPASAYESAEGINQFYWEALERIQAVPGVRHVGITDRVPLLGGYNITTLASPVDPELEAKFVEIRRVTPGFFPAAGIPLLEGRLLSEDDGRREAQVAVISDALARTLFPDGGAVGQRIDPGWNEGGYEVVGVVGSVREWGVIRDKRPAVYWPFPVPNTRRDFVFIVRTAGGDPLAVLPAVRRAIAELDPNLPLYGIMTLEDAVLERLGNRWFATALFGAFGALALALAALGIFGVLAFTVEQRTREVGIRVALGATRDQVTRMVVGQGLRLVAIGLVLGIVAALLSSRVLSGLLYDLEPTDPLTLIVVALVAVTTATLASYLPARRAARIEPMAVLRDE